MFVVAGTAVPSGVRAITANTARWRAHERHNENCLDSPFEASLLVTAMFFDVVCRLATVYVYLTALPFPLLLTKVLATCRGIVYL